MNLQLLKSKRVLNRYTQESIAEKIGISTKTYNRKELGIKPFTINEVVLLTILLELNLAEVNQIFFDNNLPFV